MAYTENDYEEFAKRMEETYPQMFDGKYGGFAVGPGWWPILESLCANIQSHIDWRNKQRKHLLEKNDHTQSVPEEVQQVVIDQIKEKFGGLRFYYTGGDEQIFGMVRMAESWAELTCEECGKPGTSRNGGWVKTLCEEHHIERQKIYKKRFGD